MNIFLINENAKEREWLTATLKVISQVEEIVCHERGYELEVEENSFDSAFILVTQDQFIPLRRQLSKQYSAKELPCPILVLSESFDSFDVSGYRNYTVDAFPSHAITPQILKYLLNTLKRDFRKDLHLKRLAHYDALTGACNRYLFSDRAKQAITSSRRQQECIAFMYFDLDKFKQINDKYGHATGDEYLRAFVATVTANIRDMDTLGRFGGDEFGLLLPKSTEENTKKLAKRILNALSKSQIIDGHKLSIATSIGIVAFEGTETVELLNYKNITEWADSALFAAKKKGKHQFAVYEPAKLKQRNVEVA
ncbi:diguanylate cyclase domain-containing protein [Agaribacter flavus]|uniref:Diguanylate cyclase domain-containing protein n=1 Tax=Agaribacter flavus TaxID=1902781 RepID=A0ABV7FRS4_9ALTE